MPTLEAIEFLKHLNSIFKKDFHSVSFDMYNLYFTIGFGYRF